MANSQISFYDYLANQVPSACYDVLQDSGLDFPRPRNKKELAAMLKKYVAVDRELALKCLARIHPDRELIEKLDREVRDADFHIKNAANKFGKTNFMNAAGCGCGFDGIGYHHHSDCKCNKNNFDGQGSKDYTPLLVTIGLFGLLYLIIDKKG